MIRPGVVIGIARAEARLTRRLVRYWVFMILAALLALLAYTQYSFIHYLASAYSSTVASMNPRYLVGALGFWYLAIFLIGLLFLGFDVRAREQRERISEVLDSQPCSNLEWVFGKFVGLLLASWVPVVLICLILLGIGLATGETVEPWSLGSFAIVMALPAFSFAIALTFAVSLAVRHRGIAIILLLVLLVGTIAGALALPVWAGPGLDILGNFMVGFPSDILPGMTNLEGLIQRTGILLVSLGLLWIAAAVHPRKDDGSPVTGALTGLVIILAGAAILGSVVNGRHGILRDHERWQAAHEARMHDTVPGLDRIAGEVAVRPGDRLDYDLELTIRAPEDADLATALFTWNPGLDITAVEDSGGNPLDHTHADGLFEVELGSPLPAGETSVLRVTAGGELDGSFAYFDAARDPLTINSWNGQLFLLGYEPIIFDRRYVGLMPGSRWLPATGSEAGRGDPTVLPVDFFELDLTVEVPDGWTAVVAGRRTDEGGGDGAVRQRFAPQAPVSPVPLLAAPFVGREVEVEGVLAEVLVHPTHARALETFDDAAEPITEWLTTKFEDARDVGLEYPYDAFSLVEAPGILRGFGGGWRLDTTYPSPGVMLMRESGFPTARFDVKFKEPKDFEDRDGGMPQAKLEMLEAFFDRDFTGGNPFVGGARSFFTYQTAGHGAIALPLDYVFEQLASRVVVEKYGFFSAFILDANMNQIIGRVMQGFFGSGQRAKVVDLMIEAVTSKSSVWDTILGTSLVELDPWEDPERSVSVLALKGNAMAESMIDDLGREKTAALLSELRRAKRGQVYGRDDVLAAGQAVGVDLGPWLEVWLEHTDLPGFTSGAADAVRLDDADDGTPRYQTMVTVANLEDVPGIVKVKAYSDPSQGDIEETDSGPVRIDAGQAMEIGLVSSKPPMRVWIIPYLSLNRGAFAADVPNVDAEDIRDGDPFQGSRLVAWEPREDGTVVVDDLDDGFEIVGEQGGGGFRLGGRGIGDDTDGGLPVHEVGPPTGKWSRAKIGTAFGRYRHTVAMAKAKGSGAQAVFTAEIPRSGSWVLEVHMPGRTRQLQVNPRAMKTWAIDIADDSGTHEAAFDADKAESGWNHVDTFEIAGGDVRVALGPSGDSGVVVADAIRWVPANRGVTGGNEE